MVSKIKKIFTKRNIFYTIIVALIVIQFIQIQGILGNFSFLQGKNTSLISALNGLQQISSKIGDDLNEVRGFLQLPSTDYSALAEENAIDDQNKNKDELQLALFNYVDFLSTNKALQEDLIANQKLLTDLKKSSDFSTFLKQQELKESDVLEATDAFTLNVLDKGNQIILSYQLSKDDGRLTMQTVYEAKESTSKNSAEFIKNAIDFLTVNKANLSAAAKTIKERKGLIATAINSKTVQSVLINKSATINLVPLEESVEFKYTISNKIGEKVGGIVLNKKTGDVSLVNMSATRSETKVTDISKELVPFLEKLDMNTSIQKKVEELKTRLDATFKDEGFKLVLSESGLKMAEKTFEDNLRIYYKILDQNNNHLSSIVIEKSTATVTVVDPNGSNSENLLFFEPGSKKKP